MNLLTRLLVSEPGVIHITHEERGFVNGYLSAGMKTSRIMIFLVFPKIFASVLEVSAICLLVRSLGFVSRVS